MAWNQIVFQQRQIEMKLVQHKLNVLMSKLYDPIHFNEQNARRIRFNELCTLDEIYWKQGSRVLWLNEGDRNSAFFYRRASNKRSRNKIKNLVDEEGTWQTKPKDVAEILVGYYENIFKVEGSSLEAMQEVLAAMQPCVSFTMNSS